MAATIDLFPTILKLANASIPEDRVIDGIDISSVLFENGQVRTNLNTFSVLFYVCSINIIIKLVGSQSWGSYLMKVIYYILLQRSDILQSHITQSKM